MVFNHDILKRKLDHLKQEGRYRTFIDLERLRSKFPLAKWRKKPDESKNISPDKLLPSNHNVNVWCSNDYLNMSHHPDVLEAFKTAADLYGVGSGGTRNIAGSAFLHADLETLMAAHHGKEAALLFSSGYAANVGSLACLGEHLPNCVIFSDEKNHASMIQGIRQSRAEKIIFRHNDMADLRLKLQSTPIDRPKIIATISVCSMDGSIAPLKEICDLADEFNAITYVDEVHAVGIYGDRGEGIAAQLGVQGRVDIIQGNFAKAYGVVGGYIAGSAEVVDFIRSHAPEFIFTTSLPPAVVCASMRSVIALQQDRSRPQMLLKNSEYLKESFKLAGVNYINSPSHIVPVLIGDAALCREISVFLMENFGVYLQPINYPTVPRGQERFRVTVTSGHTFSMVDQLAECLKSSLKTFADAKSESNDDNLVNRRGEASDGFDIIAA